MKGARPSESYRWFRRNSVRGTFVVEEPRVAGYLRFNALSRRFRRAFQSNNPCGWDVDQTTGHRSIIGLKGELTKPRLIRQ